MDAILKAGRPAVLALAAAITLAVSAGSASAANGHGCPAQSGALPALGLPSVSRAPAGEDGALFKQSVRIKEVGPAIAAAGFPRPGDVLLEIDGLRVTTPEAAERYASLAPGEQVRLTIRRGQHVRRGMVDVQACSG